MRILYIAMAALLAAGAAQADEYLFGSSRDDANVALRVDGVHRGFADLGAYWDDGYHRPDAQNFMAGHIDLGGVIGESRNWFTLDLHSLFGGPELAAPVTSLALVLRSFVVHLSAPTHYVLYDVGTAADTLMDGSGGVAAFADLGSGAVYGSRMYQPTDSHHVHTIGLNGHALADLNAAILRGDRYWALGGRLDLTPVPEPSTYALMLLGLGALRLRPASRPRSA